MAIYFISDAHLNGEGEREAILTSFLDGIKGCELLYILGDLFDFWFEYRAVIPSQYIRTVCKLLELTQAGTKIVYLAGNHDFWLGKFLGSRIGVQVEPGPLLVEHQGLRMYLAHGDGFVKGEIGYRFLKRILRSPLNIALFRLLHPDFAFPLARGISRFSRGSTQGRGERLMRDYERIASRLMRKGMDAVILAHIHRPLYKKLAGGVYINLGDWINHYTFGKLEKGVLSLERWRVPESNHSLNRPAPEPERLSSFPGN